MMTEIRLTLLMRRILAYVRNYGPCTKARVVREVNTWPSGCHYYRAINELVRLGVLRQTRPNRHGKRDGGGVVQLSKQPG